MLDNLNLEEGEGGPRAFEQPDELALRASSQRRAALVQYVAAYRNVIARKEDPMRRRKFLSSSRYPLSPSTASKPGTSVPRC